MVNFYNHKTFPLILTGILLSVAAIFAVQAAEVVTDETLNKIFGRKSFRKSHDVMSSNQERLHSMLNAFLTGDFNSIKTIASEIARSLGDLTVFLPAEEMNLGWQTIAEVSKHAKEIESSALQEDFAAAYDHYALITFQCVKCHQAVRPWGQFRVEPASTKDESPELKQTLI